MNNQSLNNAPVTGTIRAKLNEGFDLRLADNSTCFVPIKYLIGYSNDERFERYDSLNIGDVIDVVVRGVSRRPMASELQALEYRVENSLRRDSVVEFYVTEVTDDGVAVRLLAPMQVSRQSAYIHRTKVDDETFALLMRDVAKLGAEAVGRCGNVVSIRRNDKGRLSVKLAC